MLKISGAAHKPRVTGHTEMVKKTWIPKYQVPVGKLTHAFLANIMAATEAKCGSNWKKGAKEIIEEKRKDSVSVVGRRKAGNSLNSSLLLQTLGQVLQHIPLIYNH